MARAERRMEVTDGVVLAALAHPLRVALLYQLNALGSRTASQCAQALGETPANCSYHLRQLAKAGLVARDAAGNGRERPWRSVYTGLSLRPAVDDADPEVVTAARATRAARGQHRDRGARPPGPPVPAPGARAAKEWRDVAGVNSYSLRLTADELAELVQALDAAIRPVHRADPGRPARGRPAGAPRLQGVPAPGGAGMRAGWALLRRRDFGLLWTGGLISETGDWFLLVGLPVWVFKVTGSSLVTATVFLVGLLPSLVVGPLAGVLVDRWDRRRTLVAVSLAEAAFLLPLLAVDGRDQLWVVYLVMAVEAVLAQLNDPARNALVPSLVPRDDLVGANALIGLNGNLARLVGSPLGGVLVEVAGLPGLVIGDAVSFLLGAALLALVRPGVPASGPAPAARPPAGWWGSGWMGCG